jgi:dipeptidyl aminopeptidase/acylaminoacyl peptidase
MTGQLNRGDVTVAPIRLPAGVPLLAEVTAHSSPTLSPDASQVAYVSDRGGTPRVWVQPIGSGRARPVDTGPHPVVSVAWSPAGNWLACGLAPGGAARTEVWLVRPDGSGLRQVAGFGTATACLPRWLPGTGLLTVTEDVTRGSVIDPATGSARTVVEGSLTALMDVAPGGGWALVRQGPRGARRLAVVDTATGERRPLITADTGCFTVDGGAVYARSDNGAELARLVRVSLGGTTTVLAQRADADLEAFAVSPDGETIALVWNILGGTSELSLLDVTTGWQHPVGPLPGTLVADCSFSGDALTFTLEGPGRPRTAWVLDDSGAAPIRGRASVASAATPELIALPAGDGFTLTGWLYRPDGAGPHPAVISLHAGPEAQERPGYNPLFQTLVGHGIAVFAPNVRGSSGFGRTFQEADNRHGRYGAIADVAACVNHLVDTGVAESGRIGCMGRSYGGYLTLAALTAYPSLFAVGIDVCGMADFETFFAQTEPWIAAAAVGKYGCPVADRELLRDLSPVRRLDRLVAPLLVVHGANDTNVPVGEAEQVVAALRDRGVAYRYLLFPDEGHDFHSRASRQAYLQAALEWLTRHLGVEGPAAGAAPPRVNRHDAELLQGVTSS